MIYDMIIAILCVTAFILGVYVMNYNEEYKIYKEEKALMKLANKYKY